MAVEQVDLAGLLPQGFPLGIRSGVEDGAEDDIKLGVQMFSGVFGHQHKTSRFPCRSSPRSSRDSRLLNFLQPPTIDRHCQQDPELPLQVRNQG